MINIFQYWGQGLDNMPPFLKTIYKHNLEFCNKHNLNLVLIDDNNIHKYFNPPKVFNNIQCNKSIYASGQEIPYEKLQYSAKSDIVRFYALHQHGGFWFDTDVIIIKDLNKLCESIDEKYEAMFDVEFGNKIGSCSLFIRKNSNVSNLCVNYINHVLEHKKSIDWGDIGPATSTIAYMNLSKLILLNDHDTVKNGCNFICWNDKPGYNRDKWYFNNEKDAKEKAMKLRNHHRCYYIISWSIHCMNNIKGDLCEFVFNDKKSVFSYFIDYKKKKVLIKNASDTKLNGLYVEDYVQYKDNDSLSYKKNDNLHLYKYNDIWRLGENGVKVYKSLGYNISDVIDLSNIKRKYVLCSPINGINDSFNQIMKCYNYCTKTGRTLLINTNTNHKQSMRYNFSDYFNFKKTNFDIICDCNEIINLFYNNKLSVSNNLNNYLTYNYSMEFIGKEKDGVTNILCDKETKTQLNFDFNKEYNEDVLLYFQGGGGKIGKLLFDHIDLNNNLKKHVMDKINMLPNNYISIYVRNTDANLNYKKLYSDNFEYLQNKNIYLVTDSKIVLDFFKKTNLKIYNYTTFPEIKSKNLHNSSIDSKTKLYDAITDLYIMGKSSQIISNSSSGYLEIAVYLNKKFLQMNNKKYAVMWASTKNIGDDIQTLAGINFLKKKGITEYSYIDRERLSDYDGEPIILIMNGWFTHNINKFPPSNKITPIFISVHINNEYLILKNINYFKKYEPIGCRDMATMQLFHKYNIKAYFSGCLTLYFDRVKEKNEKKYLVDINTNCSYIPNIEIDNSKYKEFEIIKHDFDFDKNKTIEERLILANNLIDKYKHANLVITTRLHCILPCRAFNTNSIFIHANYKTDPRFTGLYDIINGDTKMTDNISSKNNSILHIKKLFDSISLK